MHKKMSLYLLLTCLLILSACGLSGERGVSAQTSPKATPTATLLPPPPQVAYTEIKSDKPSPMVIQRAPSRGEELSPDGVIELLFDRSMAQAVTGKAFSLQVAASKAEVKGQVAWPDGRTMRFKPNQPLERATFYDAILSQKATDNEGVPLAEPFIFRFSTPGYLEVTQVIPADGTTNVQTKPIITVMFNRPIVPMTSLEQAKNLPQPLTFQPEIKGQGQWLNTSIYVFTSSEDMPGGTTFKVRVKNGLQDATKETVLAKDFEWQFTTQPPEVVWSSPSDGNTLVGVDTAIQVTFNQPIDKSSAAKHFTLSSGLLGRSVAGKLTVVSETLTFTPTNQLEFYTTYQVSMKAGVTSMAGGQGSTQPFTAKFTTVPLPKIVVTYPTDGEEAASPYTDFTIQFNTPISPDTVMPHFAMKPPLPITPTLVYTSFSPWDNSFHVSFEAKPSTNYEVQITPGIQDPYGNKTTDDLTIRFRTAPLNPAFQLYIPDFIGMYDANLSAKLMVGYVNLNQLNLRLYRLDPKEILNQNWYDYQPKSATLLREWDEQLESPLNKQSHQAIDLVEDGDKLPVGLYYLEVDAPEIKEEYNRQQRHVLVVSQLNLTLKAGLQDALVWATDLATGQPVADVPITFYGDSNQKQLGQATTDHEGVARLEFPKLPYRSPILAMVSPESETPTLPSPESGEGKFSAVSSEWSNGINPYDFGLELAYNLPDYNVHIYSDRPIYRAGQTVYFKGVIRAEDDVKFKLLPGLKAQVTIRDAANANVFDQTIDVKPTGTFNGEVTLAQGAALGQYVISVGFANQFFEQSFQVAAYRPPEFEVTVKPQVTELLRGQDTTATINVKYFFGGPLAGTAVTWNLLATSYQFKPRQFGSYHFYDTDDPYVCFDCWWRPYNDSPQTLLSGNGTTDANGQLIVNLKGTEIDKLLSTGSYRLTIEATASGPDNQAISGRESLTLHKGKYYLGLSPRDYVADAGQETVINLVAVDWSEARLPNKKIKVEVIRHEWVNSFIENENGGGQWSYETKKEPITDFIVTTDEQGEAIARFTPPKGGSYQVVAQDEATLVNGREGEGANEQSRSLATSSIRSAIFIWVAGKDDVSWRRENNDRLTLVSDKAEYTPGETAEILIPSPFKGDHVALLTIERGHLIEYKVIKMSGSSQVYRLPITEQYAPNIYVSVVLVKGTEVEEQGTGSKKKSNSLIPDPQSSMADIKVGILPLDVKLTTQRLNINLTPNVEQSEPGKAVTYQLQVTDVQSKPVGAELSLDLVDKAILSLQPRQPEAIVEAYYHRRPLGITTASNLVVSINRMLQELVKDLELQDKANGQERSSMKGSFGGEGKKEAEMPAMAAAPAPADGLVATEESTKEVAKTEIPAGLAIRQEFSDTAYWNPSIATDANGQAKVTLTLPDNLTTWVMRGVGLTNETQVGEATTEIVSTKPLLIRPVTPRFFVVDDRAELAANVTNNTANSLTTQVILSANITISAKTPSSQTVIVPAHGETKITWDVTIPDVPETQLVFAAVSGVYSDAAKPRLSSGKDGNLLVYRYTAPDIVGTAGQLIKGESRTEVVVLPPKFDNQRGELSVQLDPSLAAGMQDGLKYLEHYEYECTEQTVSRFLPNVLTYQALKKLGLDKKELSDKLLVLVEEGLNKLTVQQKGDGGWGWWPETDRESNVHLTAYVVFALTKARQADMKVSDTVLANGQNFLLNHLQTTRQLNNSFDANRHAFILYVLAENGQAPTDSLANLLAAREKLSHYGKAYLALALQLTNAQKYGNDLKTLLSDLNNTAIMSATGAHWEEEQHDWWAMNTDTRSTAIILDTLTKLDPKNQLIPNVVRWLMIARKEGIWETTQETAWAIIGLTDWMVETGELKGTYDYSVNLNQKQLSTGKVTPANVQDSVKLKVAVANLLTDVDNRLTIARTDGNGRLYYSAHLKVYLPVEQIKPANRGIIVSRRYTLQSCWDEQARERIGEGANGRMGKCSEIHEAKLGEVIRVDLTIIAPNDLYYVVVEDPLPAGAEAIDTGLATTSLLAMDPTLTRSSRAFFGEESSKGGYAPFWWWWRWYSRSELRDEKVVLFADSLPKGSYEYSYTMRATLPGDYHVIPTLATEFYFPEVFGRSDGRLLSIGN